MAVFMFSRSLNRFDIFSTSNFPPGITGCVHESFLRTSTSTITYELDIRQSSQIDASERAKAHRVIDSLSGFTSVHLFVHSNSPVPLHQSNASIGDGLITSGRNCMNKKFPGDPENSNGNSFGCNKFSHTVDDSVKGGAKKENHSYSKESKMEDQSWLDQSCSGYKVDSVGDIPQRIYGHIGNAGVVDEYGEEEKKHLDEYITEAQGKLKTRNELRDQNASATNNRPDESYFFKMDSSLKKNTAFVKKLRNYLESQRDSIIKDLGQLNLTKYISEVASSIVDAKLKMSDINFFLELCTKLNLVYTDFSGQLMDAWRKAFASSVTNGTVKNPSKYRVDLRLYADLVALRVLPATDAMRLLASQLQQLIAHDKDEHNNLSILTSFCRHCGDDYAGLLPRRIRKLAEKYGISDNDIPHSNFLTPDRKVKCRQLIKDYYVSVCDHVIRDYKEVKRIERCNRRILQTKGELASERHEKYESMATTFQKFHAAAITLAELLDEPDPELPVTAGGEDVDGGAAGGIDLFNPEKEFQYDGEKELFEDEDTRQFYENLPDLRAMLPGILYRDSAPAPVVDASQTGSTVDDDSQLSVEAVEREIEAAQASGDEPLTTDDGNPPCIELLDDLEEDATSEHRDDASGVTSVVVHEVKKGDAGGASKKSSVPATGTGSQRVLLDAFLSQLPNCVNRDLIDKAASEFCTKFNSKVNRRKLTRTLYNVQRTRYDLLPFYARLAATLKPVMADVASDLSTLLLGELRWHIGKKDQINIESKLKTVRFLGELVKFGLVDRKEILKMFKILITYFTHHNVEMACALLDTCGRFLYRSPDTHHRTRVYLDVMMRKKNNLFMDQRYTTMIENVYYYCNPPAGQSGVGGAEIEEEPIRRYLRRILYSELNKTNHEKILKILRKVDWVGDRELRDFVISLLTEVWNFRYNHIHCVAAVIAALTEFQDEVGVEVVDNTLEYIRVGLEINNARLNQRRVCAMKFLGELYMYRLVESSVIFRTLYLLITLGVTLEDTFISPVDAPDSFFRVQLVCTLLETCGQYFDRGASRRKLDIFLVYFQRYFWYKKRHPVWDQAGSKPPIVMEHQMIEMIESLRPSFRLAESYEEATRAVTKVENEIKNKMRRQVPASALYVLMHPGADDSKTEAGLGTIQEEIVTEEEGDDDDDTITDDDTEVEEFSRRRHMTNEADDGSVSDQKTGIESMDGPESPTYQRRQTLKVIECPEDEEFRTLCDQMVSEAHKTSGPVAGNHSIDIPLPSSLHRHPQQETNECNSPSSQPTYLSDGRADSNSPPLVRYTLIKRAGGSVNPTSVAAGNPSTLISSTTSVISSSRVKTQLASMAIPSTEKFVSDYLRREQEEREEKAKMKQVVLNMHEMQNEEEEQAGFSGLGSNNESLMRQVPINVNRERRTRYQHPKGAPDADLIFGTKKR